MKFLILGLCICMLLSFPGFTQGTSCASPIILNLDGVLRSYPTSSSTGANVLCTSNGTTPITWFRITTNALGECPLLNITASDSLAIEVAFYTSCSSMLSSSSMCFYNGYGLWAPNENFVIPPNTTYYLRVKTSSACIIKIAGQYYAPPNDNCQGAFSIDSAVIYDNNACHHGGPGVTPSQLCALTLENTAWYKFYVQESGYSIITINNIHCDNGAANNNNGFQIGFFKGRCDSLVSLNCSNGSGTTVQATTTYLPAGTRVFVAIDGISGSNCSYSLNGFNITGVLNGTIKYFSGWKSTRSNILQWTTLHETGGYYNLERSDNGVDFHTIGTLNSRVNGSDEVGYSFEDMTPPVNAFYRLRQTDQTGKSSFSHIIQISRTGIEGLQINLNPSGNSLNLIVKTELQGKYLCTLFNMQGQRFSSFNKILNQGNNNFSLDISNLPRGQYGLIISNEKVKANNIFIKQ
ncbi:MAG: hypothetical protein ABIT81_01960 [Ferruginibacter sp.]